MNTKLLNKIQGKWKYQQTLYNIKSKIIKNHQNSLNINNLDINRCHIKYDKVNNSLNSIYQKDYNMISKKYNDHQITYYLHKTQENKVTVLYNNHNIIFKEIFYIINVNFFVVIGIFKKNNNYFSISITSYIKIL